MSVSLFVNSSSLFLTKLAMMSAVISSTGVRLDVGDLSRCVVAIGFTESFEIVSLEAESDACGLSEAKRSRLCKFRVEDFVKSCMGNQCLI